jgi:signal peptidase I
MAGIEPVSDATGAPPGQGAPPPVVPAAGARSSRRPLLRELPILVIVALVIAMVIKSFVVQAFVIPSGSMQDTLALQDKILVNKVVFHLRAIHPGDIVVFDGSGSWDAPAPPSTTSSDPAVRIYDDTLRKLFDSVGGLFGTPIGQTDYVKRVIGVPGDHVVCCNASGLITVNGVALHEQSYLYPGNRPGSAPAGIPGHFNVTVPAGYLWVLGDHRGISDDSRGHEADPGDGMIPEHQVIGRAFLIAWPPSRWRILSIPSTFQQPGITRTGGTAASPTAGTQAAAALPSVAIRPAAPYVPTTAGFAAAFPAWFAVKKIANRRGRGRSRR